MFSQHLGGRRKVSLSVWKESSGFPQLLWILHNVLSVWVNLHGFFCSWGNLKAFLGVSWIFRVSRAFRGNFRVSSAFGFNIQGSLRVWEKTSEFHRQFATEQAWVSGCP